MLLLLFSKGVLFGLDHHLLMVQYSQLLHVHDALRLEALASLLKRDDRLSGLQVPTDYFISQLVGHHVLL